MQLLPGDGKTGAALVGSALTAGVMFTGSTEVARLIQGQLAGRVLANGQPVPLIAETGGQNAMIVDLQRLPSRSSPTSSPLPSTVPASVARRFAFSACRKMWPTEP